MNETYYECGDGWRNLIDVTIDQVKATDRNIRIDRVKEKFGGLRISYHPANDTADHIVTLAEEIASQTCELCASGEGRNQPINGRWKTLCAGCVSVTKHGPEEKE